MSTLEHDRLTRISSQLDEAHDTSCLHPNDQAWVASLASSARFLLRRVRELETAQGCGDFWATYRNRRGEPA